MSDPFIITDDGDAVRASRILYVHFIPEEGLGASKTLARVNVETEDLKFESSFKSNAAAQKDRDRIIKILKDLEDQTE